MITDVPSVVDWFTSVDFSDKQELKHVQAMIDQLQPEFDKLEFDPSFPEGLKPIFQMGKIEFDRGIEQLFTDIVRGDIDSADAASRYQELIKVNPMCSANHTSHLYWDDYNVYSKLGCACLDYELLKDANTRKGSWALCPVYYKWKSVIDEDTPLFYDTAGAFDVGYI